MTFTEMRQRRDSLIPHNRWHDGISYYLDLRVYKYTWWQIKRQTAEFYQNGQYEFTKRTSRYYK